MKKMNFLKKTEPMRTVVFAFLGMLLALSACAGTDVIIPFNQLPSAAQQFVNDFFSAETVSFVKAEREGAFTDYEVILANGSQIEFDHNGNLEQVDCNRTAVPDGIVPGQIVSAVKAQFPNNFIVKYSVDRRDYEVELNNGLELKFNKAFKLIEIDD